MVEPGSLESMPVTRMDASQTEFKKLGSCGSSCREMCADERALNSFSGAFVDDESAETHRQYSVR
jgi:hypothetical protein